MSIEFRCPQCEKLLRVPSESAGAKAKCPQCGGIADVPQTGGTDSGDQALPSDSSRGEGANPFTEGSFPIQPSQKPAANDPVNPYSTPASGFASGEAKPSVAGEFVPTAVDIGDVIGYAWDVWKNNLGILVGITVVVFGLNIGLSVVQGAVEAVLQQQGEEQIGALLGALIGIIGNVVQIFLGIGQAQIVLKLLRRQPAEFSELFNGGPLFLRVLGASILAGLAMFAGILACIIPGILLMIYFWPFYWLIVDHKARAIESFGMARLIAQENVGTTIVIWLASIGIMLAGMLAFCVGILFAAPLVSLMWGTGYLMMSGQISARSPQLK